MEASSEGIEAPIENEFTINPETGMIVSEGHEYANTPRMREFVRRANKIRAGLPHPDEGTLRLWRGNRSDEVGANPSFTSSLEGIALPFLEAYQGDLSYIDIPKADSEKYLRKGLVAENSEFIVPSEVAKTAKIIPAATPLKK